MYIAESVTAWHPDKICDQVSDAILDACLEQDPNSRVAIETIGGHNCVSLYGEVTTKAEVDYRKVAFNTYYDLHKKFISINSNIVSQSPDIAQGVDKGGAGDQGIMIGYACRDNELFIPQEMYLARKLLKGIETDAKSQVVLNDDKAVDNVVLSAQGYEKEALEGIVRSNCGNVPMYCNNTGAFDIGGFDADSGCTGRKIVVDAYGPRVPVGGGAFSGKDPTKVDRSAAYMARFIALSILNEYAVHDVLVRLGYVIGTAEPLLKEVIINGKPRIINGTDGFDCRPQAIIERFDLKRPIYQDLAKHGHFGRPELLWESTDN